MFVPVLCLFLVAQLSFGLPASSKVTYDGHKVLEILHKTEADFLKLMQMELQYELDFWKLPKHTNDSTHVRVPSPHIDSFLNDLKLMDASVKVIIEDVQELLDSHKLTKQHIPQERSINSRAVYNSGYDLAKYYTYDGILGYMNFLQSQTLRDGITATVESLGYSEESREIKMIKFHSPYPVGVSKKVLFLDGGIHAREWVSPATLVYLMEMLAYNPKNSADLSRVLSYYDIYIVPVLNPDGYEYTDFVRMWRKNRGVNQGSSCVGVDLNRNFPYMWDPAVGGSREPCNDVFSGPNAASAKETQVLVSYLRAHGHNIAAYLTIHSYGQMWLYPWGFTSAYPSDYTDLHHAASVAAEAIRLVHRSRYDIGSSTNVLYAAAGGSDDFAKGDAGIKYAYTIELRDTGRYGFLLPTDLIEPTAEEFVAGFLSFALTVHGDQTAVVG